ncbi:MAG: DUF2791 family P-loop domain-containing protein [Leptolyngbyaceae cyanobacterium CSU_1_3]|nr:DUF2791 family P-loop domain-containing protein [Leptolyngbyaceae cyanobacterium CSU_1_3]
MERYDANRRKSITVVESLRAGIPTRTSTRELPDLRSSLTNLIRQDLEQFSRGQRSLGRLAWGPYGQGKTHALTTVEHAALDLGFAVSRVSLSREVSCHHLLNFYGRVASVIQTPDSKMAGLTKALNSKKAGDFLNSVISDRDRYSHPLPAIVLEDYFFTSGEEQDLLYGDLTGTRLSSPELKRIHRASRGEPLPKFDLNFRATQHGSAYFGVMADAIAFCGYKGWVILLDEVELIGRLGKMGRLQAYRNLNWLLNWSSRDVRRDGENELFCRNPYPIYTFGVVASSLRNDVWFSGTSTPSAKNDRTQIPEVAIEKFGADAGLVMRDFFDTAIGSNCPTIRPLETANLVTLLDRLVKLHGNAYAWDAKLNVPELVSTIGSQPIRTHIRATLEALDIAYLYHESIKLGTTNLLEASLQEQEDFFTLPNEADG